MKRSLLITVALLPLLISAAPEDDVSQRISDEDMANLPMAETREAPPQPARLDLPPGLPEPRPVNFNIIEEAHFRGGGCGRTTLPDLLGTTTVSPIGWVFPYLISGDCSISAAMLLIEDRPIVFGPVNF